MSNHSTPYYLLPISFDIQDKTMVLEQSSITNILIKQRQFFATGKTKNIDFINDYS